MFGLFGQKKRIDELKEDVQESFNHVKRDFSKVGEWIKHIDEKNKINERDLDDIKEQLITINESIIEMKDFISFFGPQVTSTLSKHTQTGSQKQTNSKDVQTSVQTSVQTDILSNLTVMERAIIWALLNSDMNLSYEDLAALLGKEKSTIRGQINSIKQKATGIIEEVREANGKKRLYIPEKIRSEVIKSVKVRVRGQKKG